MRGPRKKQVGKSVGRAQRYWGVVGGWSFGLAGLMGLMNCRLPVSAIYAEKEKLCRKVGA